MYVLLSQTASEAKSCFLVVITLVPHLVTILDQSLH